jgi:hypothetical protein
MTLDGRACTVTSICGSLESIRDISGDLKRRGESVFACVDVSTKAPGVVLLGTKRQGSLRQAPIPRGRQLCVA